MRYKLRGRTLTLVSETNGANVPVWGWDDEFGGLPGSYDSDADAIKAMERAGGDYVVELAAGPEVSGCAA